MSTPFREIPSRGGLGNEAGNSRLPIGGPIEPRLSTSVHVRRPAQDLGGVSFPTLTGIVRRGLTGIATPITDGQAAITAARRVAALPGANQHGHDERGRSSLAQVRTANSGVADSDGRDLPSATHALVNEAHTMLGPYTELPRTHGLTEDDRYSTDPERSRLYLLHAVATRIQDLADRAQQFRSQLPENIRAVLRTGRLASGTIVETYFGMITSDIPSHQEQLGDAISEVSDIMTTKGFQDPQFVLTPREHEQIHSSGFAGIYAETDPDVPVPVLRAQLIRDGLIEPDRGATLTLEEADRARRLLGKTRLDLNTGRVTDERDEAAARDSYHFLSAEEENIVRDREQHVLAEIDAIAASSVSELPQAALFVSALDQYSRGELSLEALQETRQSMINLIGQRSNIDWNTYIQEMRTIAFQSGAWDRILSPQEILLRDNVTPDDLDPRYREHPYTPLAIQDGEPIEAIARLRESEGYMDVSTGILQYRPLWRFGLASLNPEGSTEHSPAILDQRSNEPIGEDVREYFGPRIDVPFARRGEWYFKEHWERELPGLDTSLERYLENQRGESGLFGTALDLQTPYSALVATLGREVLHAREPEPKSVICMDGGVESPTDMAVRVAGPVTLFQRTLAILTQRIANGELTVSQVCNHKGCGALGLDLEARDMAHADKVSIGEKQTKRFANNLPGNVPYGGALELTRRPEDLHSEQIIIVDGRANGLDPSRFLPPSVPAFGITDLDRDATREYTGVAIAIAFGGHGLGEQLTKDNPLHLVGIAENEAARADLERRLETIRTASGEEFKDRIKVTVITDAGGPTN